MANVIVTGTSSFVGCHLARAFAEAGHTVTATYSRPRGTYGGIRADRLTYAAERADLAQLDFTDAEAVALLAERLKPDVWVHHAGYATDYASPDYNMGKAAAINLAPLDAIYEAMARMGGGVLITGTNAEYPDSRDKVAEDTPGEPATPYGRAKLAETLRARELSERHAVPTRVARLFLPFGRLDNPAKLLAKATEALQTGTPIALSPGTQRRDFIGIGDVCALWLLLADDLKRGGFEIFNACSGEATELRTLLCTIADTIGADRSLLDFGAHPIRPGEPEVSLGDNDKARRLLGWSPRPLAQAVREDLIGGRAGPKVSVLMSVLNGEAYLAEAIDSILAQTFRDFELVIVDNASTDSTAAIIAGYEDPRIVALRNPETVNLSRSLNIGLRRARGEYIARLDADDIALPERLAQQVSFLNAHPDVALVGTAWTDFYGDDIGRQVPGPLPPASHEELVAALADDNPLAHSTITYRRAPMREIGGYPEDFEFAMEHVVYFRLAARHRLAALPEPFVAMRNHSGQATRNPAKQLRRYQEAWLIAGMAQRLPYLGPRPRSLAQDRQIKVALRAASLAAHGLQLGAFLGWIGRAITSAPMRILPVLLSTACRKLNGGGPRCA